MVGASGGLAERFERLVGLTDDERAALAELEGEVRIVARAAVLERERDHSANLWVLRAGWVACALVELLERVRAAGRGQDGRFSLPMTQEEIGDTLGLTAVHVNRMLRVLAEEGLIAREGGGQIRILDEQKLCRFAGQVEREGAIDFGWLPAARAG